MEKPRKLSISIILFIFILGFCFIPAIYADTISIPVPKEEPQSNFSYNENGEEDIRIQGYATVGIPGNPMLPYKDIYVIIPQNENNITVSLQNSKIISIDGSHNIMPCPPYVAYVNGKLVEEWAGNKIVNRRNILVYNKNEFYPKSHVELLGIGNMRKWRIARIRYWPYRYNPVTKELIFVEQGSIILTMPPNAIKNAVKITSPANSDIVLDDMAKDLAVNYQDAKDWYRPSKASKMYEESKKYSYVIITTSAIAAQSLKLQDFIKHKQNNLGFSVKVVTENEWGGGIGDIASENIRKYLQDNYSEMASKYVLLIGNPGTGSGDIPMKLLFPDKGKEDYKVGSDYYYADLTGNWDLDNDGKFGEWIEDFGPGGIDIIPEVIVGRIPFYGNFSELDSILQKIINYENGDIPGGDWTKNMLFSTKPLENYDKLGVGVRLGQAIRNIISKGMGFRYTRVYDSTYDLNPAPEYYPCTYENVFSAWNSNAGFHFWSTHGLASTAVEIIDVNRSENLDNNYPLFTFQGSCYNGWPEEPSLAYALLKKGAIATLSATNLAYYYTDETEFDKSDTIHGMAYTYALKLIVDGLPCGEALYRMIIDIPLRIWENHAVFNLYGDPSLYSAAGPGVFITHTPLTDTDFTYGSYKVTSELRIGQQLQLGRVLIKWSIDNGLTFNESEMSLIDNSRLYGGEIPSQPYNTHVSYYIQAEDKNAEIVGKSPVTAPYETYTFKVEPDYEVPVIKHTPLRNTANNRPIIINAVVTDNRAVDKVSLIYHKDNGPDIEVPMKTSYDFPNSYSAVIKGSNGGGTISYKIKAIDSSVNKNTSYLPDTGGYYSFKIIELHTIKGHIKYQDAQPSVFVYVDCYDFATNKRVNYTGTDEEGHYGIFNLTQATYIIKPVQFDKYYFSPSSAKVVLNKNDIEQLNFTAIEDAVSPLTRCYGVDNLWHRGPVRVSLSAVDSGTGIDKTYYIIDNSAEPTLYTNPVVISVDGIHTFRYYSIDKAGNVEKINESVSKIKIDKTAPWGRVLINDAASTTSSIYTSLNLQATDVVSGMGSGARMKISNDRRKWSEYRYTTKLQWVLTKGEGIKNVYVIFIDAAGNQSGIYSDSIILKNAINTKVIDTNNLRSIPTFINNPIPKNTSTIPNTLVSNNYQKD